VLIEDERNTNNRKEKKMGKAPFGAKRSDVLWLDPEELVLVTDRNSPFFDKRVLWDTNDELVQNMLYKKQGVLEPIIIAKEANRPIVIDGRQRVKAARKANERLKKQGGIPILVPCILKRGDDEDLFDMSISTNELRTQDSPIDKARKLKIILNSGKSYADAAKIFGVSVTTIYNWEKLIGINEEVKKAVKDGKISSTKAAELSNLPRTEQAKNIAAASKKKVKKSRSAKEIRGKLEEVPEEVKNVLLWVLREVDELKF
jgi:ParB family chromosome partitioning protein